MNASLIDSATALQPLLRQQSQSIEQSRRLNDEVFDALYAMQAFNLQVMTRFGGAGVDPITHLKVIEALSRADGSSGWCAMVGSESSACISAFLEPDTIREILCDTPKSVVSLTAVGVGRAVQTDDGFDVTGRWRFVSGCRHASWLGGLCSVYAGGNALTGDNGAPLLRVVFVPTVNARLIDTWHTSGLRGTASDDFELDKIFVPKAHTLDLFGAPLSPSPLWRLPISLRFAMSKAAAVTGMARGAMDALMPLLDRIPFAGARPIREEARTHTKLAQAEAAIEAGRAYLYQNVEDAWGHVQHRGSLDLTAIAKVRLSVVFAAARAVEAVQMIQELGGTASALDPTLDRVGRDINVARHHLQLQAHVVEDVGRVLLGIAPQNPMF